MVDCNLKNDIDLAVASGREFGMAIFPGKEAPVWFGEGTPTDITMEIAPWLAGYSERIVIGAPSPLSARHNHKAEIPLCGTARDEYLHGVKAVIESCRERGGKTVYSRTICGTLEASRIGAVAAELFASHPGTLRFVYNTPQTGLWLGATPELLLDFDKTTGAFRTMAFAGTRKKNASAPWDTKNIRENRFVIDYIVERLSQLGISAEVSQLETVGYGEIEHLCANISGRAVPGMLQDMADAINPTPALCGWPKDAAVTDINTHERHKRGCYGGFIGFSTPQRYTAFVNLRCMQFLGGRFCIYGGGGITAGSDPDTEFAETEAKTSLLRKLTLQAYDAENMC